MDNSITLGELKEGRTKTELDLCKDALLIVASNMYYDDKLTNGEYNDVCDALCKIRDIVENHDKRYIGVGDELRR